MTAKFNNGSAKSVLLFLTSQSITLFGSTLSQMAIVWYATLYTSSGFYVAAFSLCTYLPQFLLSFPGGALADLCSRKALIICSDLSIAASTLVMLLLLPHISGKPLLFGLLLLSLVRLPIPRPRRREKAPLFGTIKKGCAMQPPPDPSPGFCWSTASL